METRYVLHYAPDNASLIIRLALQEMGLPFETRLVDRANSAQRSASYLALNPNGLIPVLETPDGPIFETGAILLWLADRHKQMAPTPDSPARGDFLKWLFFTSNTLHAALRMLFYPAKFIGDAPKDQAQLHAQGVTAISGHLDQLESLFAAPPVWMSHTQPSVLDLYVAVCLRWMALYPQGGTDWFSLSRWPALRALAQRIEQRPSSITAIQAEGLGNTPFSNPSYATPPEGSAT